MVTVRTTALLFAVFFALFCLGHIVIYQTGDKTELKPQTRAGRTINRGSTNDVIAVTKEEKEFVRKEDRDVFRENEDKVKYPAGVEEMESEKSSSDVGRVEAPGRAPLQFAAGVYSIQGRRPHMEDRFSAVADLSKVKLSHATPRSVYVSESNRFPDINQATSNGLPVGKYTLFAVYDGHAGNMASEFLRARFPEVLAARLLALSQPISNKDTKGAFAAAIAQAEEEFLDIARPQERMDGSTLVAGLLCAPDPGTGYNSGIFHVGNVGDSRAVVGKHGRTIVMSDDHKPNRPDEQARVERAGGLVKRMTYGLITGPWRVYRADMEGGLAMSRAIGDLFFKDSAFVSTPLVSAEPEFKTEFLSGHGDIAIFASDGMWDVISNDEAVAMVMKEYTKLVAVGDRSETDWDTHAVRIGKKLAEDLVTEAYDRGSSDNISAMVIMFRRLKDRSPYVTFKKDGRKIVEAAAKL
eukprot:TRINITY_DN6563_c0_g1_i2.p1 TRINITY_DN6563_c0_g1~~TRINITY_DN6563_c0_g1_i2.p1  ORF type:complete len:467 (+),score=85.81 TRINITY_DN6563_c0_g1_i2:457-1857(+)